MKDIDQHEEFSRISFCQRCYDMNSPGDQDECLIVLPDGRSIPFVYEYLRTLVIFKPHTVGFTPHIYRRLYSNKKCVEYHVACGVCMMYNSQDFIENGGFFDGCGEILKMKLSKWKKYKTEAILV